MTHPIRVRQLAAALVTAGVICVSCGPAVSAKTLKVWVVGWTSEGIKWFTDVAAKEFEKANPGVKVSLTTNVSWETRKERLSVALAAGAPPDVITGGYSLDGLSSLILPLDQYIAGWKDKGQVYDRLWSTMRAQGKTYGMPITCDTRGIIFNKQLLAKVGIDADIAPESWSDIVTIAKKTMVVDPTSMKVVQAGYTSYWGMYTFQDFIHLLMSGGANLTDSTMRKPTFNTPLGIEAAEVMQQLYDTSFPRGYRALGGSDVPLFVEGKAAMVRGLTWCAAAARAKSPAFAKQLVLHPIQKAPGLDPVVMAYVNGFGIPRSSKNPVLAFSLLKFLSTPARLFKINELIGGCSPNRESGPLAKAADSVLSPWYSYLGKAATVSPYPEGPEFESSLYDAFSRIYTRKSGIPQALEQASATWQKGLTRWWSVGQRGKASGTIGQ